MADRKRLNLSFSMASPSQRAAWKQLCAIPAGQRTDYVCRAIRRSREQDALLDAVRETIREALTGHLPIQQNTVELPQAGDADEGVLDFLRSLQDDGGEDT